MFGKAFCTETQTETHILQESPFFKGDYCTANKKTVEIERNIITTKTGIENYVFILPSTGFSEPREVRILFEELFYNKQYKPFRVICVECPLEGGHRGKVLSEINSDLLYIDHTGWCQISCLQISFQVCFTCSN